MSQHFINNKTNKWKTSIKSLLIAMILSLVFTSVSFAEGGGRYQVDPWSFGLMADTQWTVSIDPEGTNPEYVSAALAGALQEELKASGVKFVIQVGDLTDRAGDEGMKARAAAAQPLLDAGIGFFPLRGNHETYGNLYGRDTDHDMNIPAFLDAFPQTRGLLALDGNGERTVDNLFGATNFNSPDIDILNGLSYSFDYGSEGNNARFVIVDVEATSYTETEPEDLALYGETYAPYDYIFWVVYNSGDAGVVNGDGNVIVAPNTWFRISSSGAPSTNFYGWNTYEGEDDAYYYPLDDYTIPSQPKFDSSGSEFWPGDQQTWISEKLDKTTRGTEHAFVLSHRGLMGANHPDGLFGGDPSVTPEDQEVFYASLMDNGVRYMLSGHDHIHNRAIVASPEGESQVEQIIHMAASTKFYDPGSLEDFEGTKYRETQISQDLYNVGYYLYTIDGPRVNVDYYADSIGNFQSGEDYPNGQDVIDEETGEIIEANNPLYLPTLDFIKKESWGYSSNGQQFLVAQGESYAGIQDHFGKTKARILSGTNNSTSTDDTPYDEDAEGNAINGPRAFTKTVNTGWIPNPDFELPKHYKKCWGRNIWKIIKSNLHNKLKSHVLSMWGMGELGSDQTDTYVLSMSFDVLSTFFDFKALNDIKKGKFGIATYVDGKWVNAVDENFGGEKKFVFGKYKPQYGLGTYGIDPKTKTAWAVINYNADFAVAKNIKPASEPKRPKHKRWW